MTIPMSSRVSPAISAWKVFLEECPRVHPEQGRREERVQEQDEPQVPFEPDQEQKGEDDEGDLGQDDHDAAIPGQLCAGAVEDAPGRLEVQLGDLAQDLRSVALHKLHGRILDHGRTPFGKLQTKIFRQEVKPLQELGPGQDRGGRDG